MQLVGTDAPTFDCTVVVDGVECGLDWNHIHEDGILVLLFDSVVCGSDFLADSQTTGGGPQHFAQLGAKLFVVCRDPLYDLLTADTAFSMIVDVDNRIAGLYDMLLETGPPLWGYCVIDADGIVRHHSRCDVPNSASLDALVYYVEAID